MSARGSGTTGHQQPLDHLPQPQQGQGFGEVLVDAGLQATIPISGHGQSGQGHDGHLRLPLANPPGRRRERRESLHVGRGQFWRVSG